MIKLSEDKKSINFTHREHVSSVLLSDITFMGDDLSMISFPCSVCAAIAYFPISGGQDALGTQELFVELLRLKQSGRTLSQARTLAQFLVARQDGFERWRLGND